jgi:hypothetical protein
MGFRRRHRQEHVPDRRLVRPVLGGNLAIQQFPITAFNQALELVEATMRLTTKLYEAQFSFAHVCVTLLATARFFREAFVLQSQHPPPRRMVNANQIAGVAAHSRHDFHSIRESNAMARSNPVPVSVPVDAWRSSSQSVRMTKEIKRRNLQSQRLGEHWPRFSMVRGLMGP